MCDQQSLRSACSYAQSDQSLCYSLEYSMSVKLLTAHNLVFLSLKGGCIITRHGSIFVSDIRMAIRNIILEIPRYHSCLSHCFNIVVTAVKPQNPHHALCTRYTMGRLPVSGDNPRALASGLSYVRVDKHCIIILYHLHLCRPCTSWDISCLSW